MHMDVLCIHSTGPKNLRAHTVPLCALWIQGESTRWIASMRVQSLRWKSTPMGL